MQDESNELPDHSKFDGVKAAEYDIILKRRTGGWGSGVGKLDTYGAPEDLFGVALSGGGIRSASFCLGVLQALKARGLIPRIDYLSTVSGGGYIGASMVAAMSRAGTEGQFPFAVTDEASGPSPANGSARAAASSDDVRDSEPVSHIRDHSRYLIPHGMGDILPSLAIVFRGLAVNAFLVLALLLPLATVTVIANPTAQDLPRSIFYQIAAFLWTGERATCTAPGGWCGFPFVVTVALVAVTFLYLLGWGLWRSLPERHGIKGKMSDREVSSRGTWLSGVLMTLTLSVFLAEAQGPILAFLRDYLMRQEEGHTTLPTIATVLTAFVVMTASLRATLVDWIQKAMKDATIAVKLRAIASKGALVAAGLIVPLLLYAAFLALSLWGIADRVEFTRGQYSLSPDFLFYQSLVPVLSVVAGLLLCWEIWVFLLRAQGLATLATLFRLMAENKRKALKGALVLAAIAAFLVAAAIATRGSGGYGMVTIYLLATAIVLMLTINFSENANGLHRLYRERLSTAFRLGKNLQRTSSLRLTRINGKKAPYLLINTTLNARQRSDDKRDPQFAQVPKGDRRSLAEPDPVKRGRNAEFFLFSRNFVGSDLTGYVSTRRMEQKVRQLDLATAVAISGAAVSSSMGRVQIGLLRPTLALLNLRLGYWMLNPRFMKAEPVVATEDATPPSRRPWYYFGLGSPPEAKKVKAAPTETRWYDFLRAYLVAESFGLLSGDAAKVYLTDGGHIDNIGLYQLLKRKCRVIIVADAEADPAMTFGALVDAERFARIDLGVRIDIKWQPVRVAALSRNASREQYIPEASPAHDCHFAIGEIDYGADEKGVLLYIKATATGDEPDYVLDYERRFPAFPHETTGDQFFSEEQMEAYRALGFHAAWRALAEPDPKKPSAPRPEEVVRLLRDLKKRLGIAPPPPVIDDDGALPGTA
ncbi:patatin-like phospholipase family protein [Sinorhizobium sp. RAC02]|uniref:patatin-like phospholipase family protein n=1 Tax=Sinorhizobium sp. RAC02 TaxID=1842534 RepID=UPI000855264A|nr:patatin-like phospholipase family protein [Sinorhizobium sp. RAC02]AOF90197.1 patatin-like phospholipase family protein [Sinorhizobium sp. RAC02]